MEWYGNGQWPSGTTVHANPDGTAFETRPTAVDGAWHNWRMTWNAGGMYFWEDSAEGMDPYFSVAATGIEDLRDPTHVAVQRRRLHDVSGAESRGRRFGRRRPRVRRLSGGNAGRLGARLLSPRVQDAHRPGAWLYNTVCGSRSGGTVSSRRPRLLAIGGTGIWIVAACC